jgi:LacI family transcriptional regulator
MKRGPGKSPTRGEGDLRKKRVTLKVLAEHLDLSPATVSIVLNDAPVAASIPRETKARIFAAAAALGYRPNHLARSLRRKRSFSVGVLVPEISEGYAAGVMSGVEHHLIEEGYFYLVASHRSRPDLVDEYLRNLDDRSVEGFILVAAQLPRPPRLPTVAVAGHKRLDGVTNVVLDHDHAARLALEHLAELGHERIAFFKGHPHSADTEDRWQAIVDAAGSLGLEVRPELTLQLAGNFTSGLFSAEEGYREGHAASRELLARGAEFTALFAFNDISAIGAMRAFRDAGLQVPLDVSIVGFDDIQSAAFQNPSLTTVRQPLREMGETAGRILLERLAGNDAFPDFVTVEPELMVRASTAPAAVRAAA